MISLYPPPYLNDEELETLCEKLSSGIDKCRGISKGGRTLMWDCLTNILEHYKHLSYNDAVIQAMIYMNWIDPNGNEFDISGMVSDDGYYQIKTALSQEFDGYYDDAIEIGLKCMEYADR